MSHRDYDPTRHTPMSLPTVNGGEIADSAMSMQERADELFKCHGRRADSPRMDETDVQYTRRLLSTAKRFSPSWAKANVEHMHASMLPVAFSQIVDEGVREFKKPSGPLRMREIADDSGRKIREFYGDPGQCWDQFKVAPRYLKGFTSQGRGRTAPGAVVPVAMQMSDGSVRSA